MTPDEANAALRTVVQCLAERRPVPLAWHIHRDHGRDVVAEAWDAATSPITMMTVLRLLWPDVLRLIQRHIRRETTNADALHEIRRECGTLYMHDLLAALERGPQAVSG